MRLKAIQAHLVFVSLLIATQCALAQTNDLQFNHLLGSNGITLGKINAITQDKLGFIWLSDQSNRCLVRYDGNHMKRFSYSQGKPNTLGGYYPECLATDPSGILWIGFYGQGLDRYDPYTNTFTHYSHSDDDPESLSNNVVSAVLVDHLGNVWIGTDGGLDLFDAATGKFKHFKHDPADSTSLSHDVVRSIYEDRQGVLWVGTGIAFVPGDEGGLNRFDRTIGTFTRYIHEPENPNSLVDNKVRAIFEDSYGNFWVGTRGDGIHKMNREAGTFQRFRFNPADPNALSRLPSIGGADHITFIIEDTDRKVWFGSLFNGVTRYDPSSGALERFGAETPEFSDNTSWCAYAAPDGHVWLSTQNSNLFRIDLHNTVIPYYAGPGYVRAYLQESSSVAWFGTDNGLIREDRNEGQRQVFRHDPNNPTSISSNDINAIIKDSNGEFWIGTTNGLNRYDPSTKLFTRYYHDPNDTLSLGDNNIQKITEDGNGYLWIGTNTSGFYVFDRKAGKVHKAFPGYYGVWALAKIGDQYLWGGTPQMGFRYDIKNEEFNYFFDGIGIQCYYPDAKGLVWIGTEQGLYCYNHKKDVFDYSQFTRIDIEGSVSSIMGDSRGNLWMTSPNIGLIRYTPETRERIVYGKRNNVQLESLATSTIYQAEDGNLLIGTRIINGYHKFNPDEIRENQDSSRLYFSSLSLNGIDFTVGDGSVFTGSIFTASNIRLAHNQNTFALRFTEIDFTNDAETRIYYRLENYDTEWRHSYAEEPANYFQIPPGEYVFKIRANHSQSGRWTERSLAITIAPPWWTTWWAYSGYGLLFMGGVFLVDRVQRKRIINKERALARERELAQAKEIEKAYNELKTTQAQLIQSEKMASLGELTAGIAHEIQNPLNFVNNFSEVNKELADELEQEIDKGNYTNAQALVKDIKANEEKINHHGKRADAIVKGMLQHSRTSSGQKEPTDINALCDEYLRLSYHGLRAKDKSFNVKLETNFDESLPKVNLVPQEIGRVVLNLINNALYVVNEKRKANNSEYEPIVTVSTKKSNDKVLISVKDNGPGIPDSIKEKIFQPFFTTKPSGQGTGLGLSLSYDIISAHRGELKLTSKENEGAEFIIILPILVS